MLSLSLLSIGQGYAMWTEADDTELVRSSPLIVIANYIGESTFYPAAQSTRLTLGVLQLEMVLQGKSPQKLVLLRVPTPGFVRKSDDIIYKPGQSGLWFLREDEANPGLYLADHPQRFVPESEMSKKIQSIQHIINQ